MDRNMEYHSETQTLLGKKSKTYINEETGEKIKAEQITKRAYGQKHFRKIYLMDFLQISGVLDSKQVDVFIYILENTEQANNIFIGSQRDIAKGCNVSLDTVSRIMKKLQENEFIKQVKRSVYQVSPDVMMKGNEHKKSLILNYYNDKTNDES
ncbi:replication/maintenance protein RepL [Virgibacillus necropolis]|uniref:Replication protein n=1 Tax=Virgibacillus necropolis TaxID=163877 RepID=A0A221M917_9BACI|nr:replication/maintenance protein RepL [Virgibacillus necropolis]ASN04144.1 replication protein [Virgibacillus necropolis]